MKHVLYVCATFPPRIGGAIGRNLGFVRALPAEGWMPTVLTVSSGYGSWADSSPLVSLPASIEVVRAWSPTYPGSAARYSGRPDAVTVRGWARRFALTWLLIPDRDVPWIPFAIARGLEVTSRSRFAAILSSGPPHSAHVVAAILARARRLRWVADCTDPWAGHPYADYASPVRDRIDAFLERVVLRRVDVVVTASEHLSAAYASRLAGDGSRVVTIPNGYDEAEFAGLLPDTRPGPHIVHVGSFYGPRSPGPFLAAVSRVVARLADDPCSPRVTFAGYADSRSRALIAEAQRSLGSERFRYEPFVPRQAALRLMLGADVLLLVTDPGPGGRGLVPLKTFEYLRAGRPILALVPEGEAKDILGRTGGARFAAPDDTSAIADVLHDMLTRPDAQPRPEPVEVERFELTALARRLASVLAGVES